MPIKEHDFIELEYTGRLADNTVFDTTSGQPAQEPGTGEPQAAAEPLVICVGERQVVPGLDQALAGKELNASYTVTLKPEQAFGRKDAKKIRLVPSQTFREQRIMPHPGLQVEIDNHPATVLSVSGGRVLVDFNHPLAGKEVLYEFKAKRLVTDKAEQIRSYLRAAVPFPADVQATDGKARILLPHELPEGLTTAFAAKLQELTGLEIEFAKAAQAEERADEQQEKEPRAAAQPKQETGKQPPAKKPEQMETP